VEIDEDSSLQGWDDASFAGLFLRFQLSKCDLMEYIPLCLWNIHKQIVYDQLNTSTVL